MKMFDRKILSYKIMGLKAEFLEFQAYKDQKMDDINVEEVGKNAFRGVNLLKSLHEFGKRLNINIEDEANIDLNSVTLSFCSTFFINRTKNPRKHLNNLNPVNSSEDVEELKGFYVEHSKTLVENFKTIKALEYDTDEYNECHVELFLNALLVKTICLNLVILDDENDESHFKNLINANKSVGICFDMM